MEQIQGNAAPTGQEGVGFYVAEDLATAQHYGTHTCEVYAIGSKISKAKKILNSCGLMFPQTKGDVKEYVKAMGKKRFSFLKSEYEKVGPIVFSHIVGRAVGGHEANQLVLRQHHIKSLHVTAACVPNSQYHPPGDTHFSFSSTWNDIKQPKDKDEAAVVCSATYGLGSCTLRRTTAPRRATPLPRHASWAVRRNRRTVAMALARNGVSIAVHFSSEESNSCTEQVASSLSKEFGTKTRAVVGKVQNFDDTKATVEQILADSLVLTFVFSLIDYLTLFWMVGRAGKAGEVAINN
ncbi:hypothetical protein HK405_005215 [Cladochytrium tenue]|nr:hypothetical protein HK405_005215 [Cladochytrium tenue]